MNSTVSKVDQTIVQHFIEEGYYERHLNKTRALYKGRHDVLIRALQEMNFDCKIAGEYAGVHLLMSFADHVSESELVRRAENAEVKVYGLSDYCIGENHRSATILLGYANLSEEEIREATAILKGVWTDIPGVKK